MKRDKKLANEKPKRLIREELLEKRKKATAIFENEYPGCKVIAVKKDGLQLNAAVKKISYQLLEQNPLPEGKLPRITLAMGANPGTGQIVPIEWISKAGKHFEVFGSIVYIDDNGQLVGVPGIIA